MSGSGDSGGGYRGTGARTHGAADLELPAWAVVSPKRVAHIGRVVGLLETWAEAMRLDAKERARWRRAAVLHDALRDAAHEVLERYEPRGRWPVRVWHGPAAAAAAERDGERDRGVLDAVRYHSLGYAGWDSVGRMLYLADYLEPGRTFERAKLDALARRVAAERDAVLGEILAERLSWRLKEGGPIAKETWDFWNSLAAEG